MREAGICQAHITVSYVGEPKDVFSASLAYPFTGIILINTQGGPGNFLARASGILRLRRRAGYVKP